MNKDDLFLWISEQYGTEPEYPWMDSPDAAVLRNLGGKWYGLVMSIPSKKLGLSDERHVDILNIKCSPLLIGSLTEKPWIFPAYHMNKTHWVSILLDETADTEEVKLLVEMSHQLTLPKPKRTRK